VAYGAALGTSGRLLSSLTLPRSFWLGRCGNTRGAHGLTLTRLGWNGCGRGKVRHHGVGYKSGQRFKHLEDPSSTQAGTVRYLHEKDCDFDKLQTLFAKGSRANPHRPLGLSLLSRKKTQCVCVTPGPESKQQRKQALGKDALRKKALYRLSTTTPSSWRLPQARHTGRKGLHARGTSGSSITFRVHFGRFSGSWDTGCTIFGARLAASRGAGLGAMFRWCGGSCRPVMEKTEVFFVGGLCLRSRNTEKPRCAFSS
jgi:hypothetical protein